MKITIGKFDRATGTVPVTFSEGARRHSRAVNAVLAGDGSYDREATRQRAGEVGLGVARKWALGLLGEETAAGDPGAADSAGADSIETGDDQVDDPVDDAPTDETPSAPASDAPLAEEA